MAGFEGFAPVDQPRVVIYVGIIDPAKVDQSTGNQQAAPVLREVAEQVLQSSQVAPDRR